MKPFTTLTLLLAFTLSGRADEAHDLWPGLAPGETTRHPGVTQPFRPHEKPPVTRVTQITQPKFTVHLAEKPNGAGIVILPGGGFGKVVTDKEGTEAAKWLNELGIAAFVLSYRTNEGDEDLDGWEKPLQDAQRLLSMVRSRAEEWKLKKNRIGLLGFSAGGHVAARVLSSNERSYRLVDDHDYLAFRPDFALLIYPWKIYDPTTSRLAGGIEILDSCPTTFLLHTDDDQSTSLGAVLFYAGLKKKRIPAELHVYGNGGHGYGLREVEGSEVATWPDRAAHWLKRWLKN
ncbi:MAG: alpha/beta hydrolase [Verrucomicrobiota bacterium]